MRVAVRFDVTDEQRNALACLLAGKKVARKATREDFTAFVMGAVESIEAAIVEATGSPPGGARPATPTDIATPAPSALRGLTEAEERLAERLRSEGKPEGYIRGWISASRSMFGGRLNAG